MRTPLAMQTYTEATDSTGAPIRVGDIVLIEGEDKEQRVCRFRGKLYVTPRRGESARVRPFNDVANDCLLLGGGKGRAA